MPSRKMNFLNVNISLNVDDAKWAFATYIIF